MKKLTILFVSTMVILGIIQIGVASSNRSGPSNDDSITILCSPDLKKLTNDWTTEYLKLNPDEQIRVLNINEENNAQPGKKVGQIGFYSCGYLNELNTPPSWQMVVGREIFVMIMNQENPFIDQVVEKGISRTNLSEYFNNEGKQNWSALLDNDQDIPAHFYIEKNETPGAILSKYVNRDISKSGLIYEKDPAVLVSSVLNDKNAIGFCRLTDIINPEDNSIIQGIALVPIDKNENGRIDSFENIYGDVGAFSRGVWIGKYPRQFIANIYLGSAERPSNAAEVAFLKWVLTDGQKMLIENGYNDLVSSEKTSNVDKLTGDRIIIIQPDENNYAGWKVAILVAISLIIIALIIETIIYFFKNRNIEYLPETPDLKSAFDENSVESPGGLFFDKTHTWAFMENNGSVKIGVDAFLAHVTGQLTRVKMKKTGNKIKKNEVLLSIMQNGKQLTIKSPVSGTIIEENRRLKGNPSLINTSPYNNGWVYVVKPDNWLREIQFLFMADKFRQWLKTEFIRLKDFFAFVRKTGEKSYVPVILQEGGQIKEGVLMNFGPEIWEDFQEDFIDKSV